MSVMITEGQALLIDIKDNFSIMETAKRADDGLFYISDLQKWVSTATYKPRGRHISAMIAIV